MKKLYIVLIALFTIITLPALETQAFDIPLNYGESDNDEPFVQTKNLFDNIIDYADQEVNSAGNIVANINYDIYEINDLLPNTDYVISGQDTVALYYMLYNSVTTAKSSRFLSTIPGDTFNTSTYDTVYLSVNKAQVGDIQLELGSTATSYAPYGFLSLNDIFVDGQILTNGDFNNGTNGWVASNSTNNVTDGILTNTGNGGSANVWVYQLNGLTNNINYFTVYRARTTNNLTTSLRFWKGASMQTLVNNPIENVWYNLTFRFNANANSFYLLDHTYSSTADANGSSMEVDYAYLYDLNALGIDNLSEEDLNGLYQDWQTNNIYNQGYTDGEASTTAYASGFDTGYTTGYNDGYGDAVTEDNAYSLGYALGLQEGQDMETGSSIIVLVLAALSFGFMIFGFSSRKRIFNLFAAGLFIALGGLMVEYAAFIIISIGFVIFNIWYTFASD